MRILVVGAGVMGLAAAEALLQAGHSVAVFDQAALPNPLASSVDEHRLIRYPYGDKAGYARLVTPAFDAWGRLWERLGQSLYLETGTLVVSRERGGWMDSSAAGLAEIGRPVEWLDSKALEARFPLLRIDPADRGYHLPNGGMLLARRIVERLAARVAMLGGSLNTRRKVIDLDCEGGRLTLDGGGTVSGDLVVVTAGPWLPDLLADFAGRVTPSRQVYAYLTPPPGSEAAWAAHPMLLDIGSESGFYLVPPAAGTGMKVGDHEFSLTGHPDRDREGGEGDVAESLEMAKARLKDFEAFQVARVGTCFYTVEAGERFIAEQRGAAWILTGFSGHGFKFAPLIGEQLAEVVAGRLPAEAFKSWISGGPGVMQDTGAVT